MIVIGLILVLVAVGAGVFAALATAPTTPTVELSAFGLSVSATPLALYLSGAASVLLLVAGLWLVARGTRRRAKTRRELKQLRKDQSARPSVGTASSPSSASPGGSTSSSFGMRQDDHPPTPR